MTMDCGIMCHSLDGSCILSVNRAALNILGYSSQEELTEGFDMVASSVAEEDGLNRFLRNAGLRLAHDLGFRFNAGGGVMLHP
mgnify:CR=1 FL=1